MLPSEGTPTPRRIRLVLLVASHLMTETRVLKLKRTLASISAQQGTSEAPVLADVLLSWSAEPNVRELAASVIDMFNGVRSFERPRRRTQFEHYASLCKELQHAAVDGESGCSIACNLRPAV